MLQCSTSLWSADLANLAAEIRRVEPYSSRFHLDVADGHYVPNLLFFPDQVRALRGHTSLPFEVHLMTTDPLAWIEPFADAGADLFLFCFDSLARPDEAIEATKRLGKQVGFSLLISEPVDLLAPYVDRLDLVTVIGTAMGIKGASMDERVPSKIRAAKRMIAERGLATLVEADGGIRRETVPLTRAEGVDLIVPGSLMFKGDPAETRQWLNSLG